MTNEERLFKMKVLRDDYDRVLIKIPPGWSTEQRIAFWDTYITPFFLDENPQNPWNNEEARSALKNFPVSRTTVTMIVFRNLSSSRPLLYTGNSDFSDSRFQYTNIWKFVHDFQLAPNSN